MKTEVHNLICRADLPFATTCLASLQRTASEQIRFVIHEDGSFTEDDIQIVQSALANAEVIRRRDAEDRLQSVLSKYPTLRNARCLLPHFMKLLDIPMLANGNFVNYVDSDVLFLRQHCGLFLSDGEVHGNARFIRDLRSAYGFRVRDYAPFGFVHPVSCLNSGLFSIRREMIDFEWLEFVSRQIGTEQLLRHRSWSEQGLWAAIAGRLGCEFIDQEQVASAEDVKRLRTDRIALHFIRPVRHLLTRYLHRAVPARAPERIRTCDARRRNFLWAARDAIHFRVSRFRTQFNLSSTIRLAIPERFRPIGFLTQLVEQRTGRRVRAGPFAGMNYVNRSCGSAYLPKLLGTYERELHWCVENICSIKPGLILNVGAAEGYYAIGLALRNPQARVIGFEMKMHGQQALREMTELNNVADRVEVRGQCEQADLSAALGEQPRPVVVCDVEGYEAKLLDPAAVPALHRAAILVELHDFLVPGITDKLQMRFARTHRITHVRQESRTRAELPWRTLGTSLLPKSYLDWAVSEWRPVQMRWLWMTPTLTGSWDLREASACDLREDVEGF